MTKNKKRDSKSHEKTKQSPMKIARIETRIDELRAGNVIDFQGQPMWVRKSAEGENGGLRLSLSRALKTPENDNEIKVGRKAAQSYEAWCFTTRPISIALTVDRFCLVTRSENPNNGPKRRMRKRANASDRVSS
jgi:hypothetical protein